MARYTFSTAYLKAEQLRKKLNDAEERYLCILEKVLIREHFKDGKLNMKAGLSNFSRLELSSAFKPLQKALIDYQIMVELTHRLREEKEQNERDKR